MVPHAWDGMHTHHQVWVPNTYIHRYHHRYTHVVSHGCYDIMVYMSLDGGIDDTTRCTAHNHQDMDTDTYTHHQVWVPNTYIHRYHHRHTDVVSHGWYDITVTHDLRRWCRWYHQILQNTDTYADTYADHQIPPQTPRCGISWMLGYL